MEKKWDHLAIRPYTFERFNELSQSKSQNAFVVELLNIYEKRLEFLDKRRKQRGENNG